MQKLVLMVGSLMMLILSGCNKPDPNAYLQDPIYQDYVAELSKATAASAEAAAQIKEHEAAVAKAVPQTGQVKFPQKWLYEAKENKAKSDQMVKYWEIKIQSRKKAAQNEYLVAFRDKKKWPDPAVYDQYMRSKQAQQKSRVWDPKSRVKEYQGTLPAEARSNTPNSTTAAPTAGESGGEAPQEGH